MARFDWLYKEKWQGYVDTVDLYEKCYTSMKELEDINLTLWHLWVLRKEVRIDISKQKADKNNKAFSGKMHEFNHLIILKENLIKKM